MSKLPFINTIICGDALEEFDDFVGRLKAISDNQIVDEKHEHDFIDCGDQPATCLCGKQEYETI